MHFIWQIFFNSANTRYLSSLMCVICAKDKEVVANSGYTNICFTINGFLKIVPSHFRHFHCFNFKMTFDKHFMKKLPFFNFIQISTMPQNYAFWEHLAIKWIPKMPFEQFTEFAKNVFFIWILHVTCRYLRYLIFAVSKICANCCFMISNPSYID